tara:strand:- start:6855 stop:7859 length:1005 start_codon:yes stop_codon:yes gene_type:complete
MTNHSLKLTEIINLIKNNYKFINSIALIFTIICCIYIFIADQYYVSYISVYKNSENKNMQNIQGIGGLSNIAQNLGLNINNSGSFDYYIPDLVDSRTLQEALILNKWDTEFFVDSVNLIEFWEIDESDSFIGSILNKYDTKYKAITNKEKKIDKAINILRDRIRITEKETGLFMIQITMKEPKLAMDIANYIASHIEQYISVKLKQISSKDLEFINERVVEAKSLLNASEDILMQYQKDNYLEIETDPVKQLELARLYRQVEGDQQVYITLKQQLELLKIDHLKEKNIVNILDRGKIYPDPVKPKKLLLLLLTTISSFFASIYFLILKNKINNY